MDAKLLHGSSKIMPKDMFDPKLFQIRWVLGAIRPEDLPDQAALALEFGFDGTSLRQLAGLVRPSLRDLEILPNRAFTEMGLTGIDKEQAATALIARGLPHVSNTISMLVQSFPSFSERWKRHVMDWGGEPAGSYNDIKEFVDFVADDLYPRRDHAELRRFFNILEGILAVADDETKNLIAAFFERLQNAASRTCGSKVFEEFFGPKSKQLWKNLQTGWAS